MLVGPDGAWREHLWLDAVLAGDPAAAGPAASEPEPVLTTPLPINTCSLDSLTLLPRVGPVLAGRIDAMRRAGTVFRTADDLQQVKGIGPRLAARLDTLVLYAPPAAPAAGDSAKSR
jgi:hypothetical protein